MGAISSSNRFMPQIICPFNLFVFTASPHPNHVGRACLKLKVYVRPPGKSRSNYTHTHTHRSRLAIKVKLGGNKRSDRMPRQHSLLWFTDQPGNTLTPLHTLKNNTHTHRFWRIHTARARTQAQSGIRTSHQITSHHTGCEGDLLSLQKENRAGWKCSRKTLPSLHITPPVARFAHKKQESNLIINPSHTVEV